jgi:hypothetical protein
MRLPKTISSQILTRPADRAINIIVYRQSRDVQRFIRTGSSDILAMTTSCARLRYQMPRYMHFLMECRYQSCSLKCRMPFVRSRVLTDVVCMMQRVGAGHTFLIVMRDAFPIHFLNAVKACPEVCRIFCATSNAVQVKGSTTVKAAHGGACSFPRLFCPFLDIRFPA